MTPMLKPIFEFGQTVYFRKHGKIVSAQFCGLDSYGDEATVRIEAGTLERIDLKYTDKPMLFASVAECVEAMRQESILNLQGQIENAKKKIEQYQNDLLKYSKGLALLESEAKPVKDMSQLGNILDMCED